MAKGTFVSVIIPWWQSSRGLPQALDELTQVLIRSFDHFEIILVEDGPEDGSSAVFEESLSRYESLRVIRLMRTFGIEIAITAGLDAAIGDVSVVFLPGFDRASLIPELVEKLDMEGAILLGTTSSREAKLNIIYRAARRLGIVLLRSVLGFKIPFSSTYFMALDRVSVVNITQTREGFRFLRVLALHIGLDLKTFDYEPVSVELPSPLRRGLVNSVLLFAQVLFKESAFPLHAVTVGCFAGSVLTFVENDWRWGILLLAVATLSQYVARIMNQLSDRAPYYVKQDTTSVLKVRLDQSKNVTLTV